MSVTIYDYYLVICIVCSFVKAIVSCRLKPRWEDICAFRAFPYKFQTSLQLFELVDDYIQSEINKPLLQATCTVSFSINISHFMLTHSTLPTYLRDRHALLCSRHVLHFSYPLA